MTFSLNIVVDLFDCIAVDMFDWKPGIQPQQAIHENLLSIVFVRLSFLLLFMLREL